eukprot:jgi/Picre1/35870/NNA_003329.t1
MKLITIVALICCVGAVVRADNAANNGSRIIGGEPTKKGDYQEFVALQIYSTQPDGELIGNYCGGTLIAKNIVLTAAHCLEESPQKKIIGGMALKGNIRHSKRNGFSADNGSEFKTWVQHPKYRKDDGYDIAIVVLKKSLPKPFATLPKPGQDPPTGSKVTVVGFGLNNDFMVPTGEDPSSESGGIPNKLYQVRLTVGEADKTPCPKAGYGPLAERFTPRKELCYYGDEFYTTEEENYDLNGGVGIKNDCNGDSGVHHFTRVSRLGLCLEGVRASADTLSDLHTRCTQKHLFMYRISSGEC